MCSKAPNLALFAVRGLGATAEAAGSGSVGLWPWAGGGWRVGGFMGASGGPGGWWHMPVGTGQPPCAPVPRCQRLWPRAGPGLGAVRAGEGAGGSSAGHRGIGCLFYCPIKTRFLQQKSPWGLSCQRGFLRTPQRSVVILRAHRNNLLCRASLLSLLENLLPQQPLLLKAEKSIRTYLDHNFQGGLM